MAILRAPGIDAARAMLDADPAIASGIFVADLHHWHPRFHDGRPLAQHRRQR